MEDAVDRLIIKVGDGDEDDTDSSSDGSLESDTDRF